MACSAFLDTLVRSPLRWTALCISCMLCVCVFVCWVVCWLGVHISGQRVFRLLVQETPDTRCSRRGMLRTNTLILRPLFLFLASDSQLVLPIDWLTGVWMDEGTEGYHRIERNGRGEKPHNHL